ncbi:MAG TPA: helix-turn-helix domain-containing protein [Thermoplasmata archaeon]|nr:helix-turn-helix domain-containing protein [Thermoplasmata archaeon]HEV2428931.1 helix-turn-helix domain-containing protein [Thermoplasmata archaeon]
MPGRSRAGRPVPSATPVLLYQNDPIRQSVDRLGRKWVLLLLRDLAFLKIDRFGRLRRNNPGLSPRVLSRRLREMVQEGLVVRETEGKEIRYRLTARGDDATFILLAFLQYGLKHHVGPQPPVAPPPAVAPSRPGGASLVRSGRRPAIPTTDRRSGPRP